MVPTLMVRVSWNKGSISDHRSTRRVVASNSGEDVKSLNSTSCAHCLNSKFWYSVSKLDFSFLNSTCDAQCVDMACGAALDLPSEEDELVHYLWRPKVLVCLIAVQPRRLRVSKVHKALFSKPQDQSETRLPDVDPAGGR